MNITIIALLYVILINVVTFVIYGIDKLKARKSSWRIPEATLLWLAVCGGSIGAWLGMKVWHHKTLHKKFKYGVPAILVVHVIMLMLLGGAAYLIEYSLNPGGKDVKDNESYQYLDDNYPGTTQWIDDMLEKGILRDTFVVNSEGLRLHAYHATHDKAKGTVVLVHGYTDNAIRMMMLGKLYYDSLQFNIILPEHVRHGKSEGKTIQMGWLDRKNVEKWIDIADAKWKGCPIYLHGISMGAATVMMCSGDPLPVSVKGIIEDCGYTSVWDEFSGEIKNQFHLPVHPLMDIASLMCKVRYGWSFKEASALEQVRKSTLPILFIHGDADTFVPTSMVYPLYEVKGTGYKRLWIGKGSEHAFSYRDHREEYYKEVVKFVKNTDK